MYRYVARPAIGIASLLFVLAAALPSNAAETHYVCSGASPIDVGTSTTIGMTYCSIRIPCPTTATQCRISATVRVDGLGMVGGIVAAFPGTGGHCGAALLSCALTIEDIVILSPGGATTVFCHFGAPPDLTVAANVKVSCEAVSRVG